jgi:hypothetical protein
MSERIEAWYDDLPLLPGEVGVAVMEITEVYERIEFPDLRPEPESFTGWTKAQLYQRARTIGLRGRSRMTKAQLRSALLAA